MELKRVKVLITIVAIVLLFPTVCSAQVDINGQAGMLIDMRTGKVLMSKNPHQRRAPASLTKIMTALVALEEGNLKDTVEVSSNATKVEPTKVWLRAGEKFTLENLLYAMLVHSANDAAVAIAEHIGGSVQNFAALMNDKAVELGAKNTHFKNPHGLDREGHYSTAYDMALIAREAMQNEKFREIVATKKRKWNGMDWDSHLVNFNKLLWRYEGATGIKTGYTSTAGRCLVSSAQRDGQEFISVVMGASSEEGVYSDSIKLLDYGFENFKTVTLVEKGQTISEVKMGNKNVPVMASQQFRFLVQKSDFQMPRWEISIKDSSPPINKDQEIGNLRLIYKGKEIANIPLVAGIKVPKKLTWQDWYFRVTAAIFLLILLLILVKLIRKRRKNRMIYGKGSKTISLDYRAMRRL